MKQDLFSIGEISKIKGITVKALRFYETLGLITPDYIEPFTRYRYYSTRQFITLDIIKACRNLDISLKDIQVILCQKSTESLMHFLNAHKENSRQKILALQKTIDAINLNDATIQQSLRSISNKGTYYKDIPLRYIVSKPFPVDYSETNILVEYSNLYKQIDDYNLMNTYQNGILYESDVGYTFHPKRIIIEVKPNAQNDPTTLSNIQAGHYLCICYNKDNAESQLKNFYQAITENHLYPIFMVQVELLHDVFEEEHVFFEMQTLVNQAMPHTE